MAKRPRLPPPNAAGLPPDYEQRQRILDELDTTMLVEAAAGTGKTTSMVGRMVGLLRDGKCQIDTLAAVTFTRKSAAELRARFQVALERAAASASGLAADRLAHSLLHVERCFIGTIHSFCGRVLRERPMEAGVDLAFSELEDTEDLALRDQAWNAYVSRLFAEDSSILTELDELGIEISQLQPAFVCFAGYPDVDEWPAPDFEFPDLGPIVKQIEDYAADMEQLAPTFPVDRGNDALMNSYELISRMVRQMNRTRRADVMDVVAQFRKVGIVQKQWPGGASQGKKEKERWEDFVQEKAEPLLAMWRELRYAAVIRILQPAVEVYDRLRHEAGGLNFQDLLMKAAALLRDKPAIRQYFRQRFTHILVDEFQDTDPIQAEVMLLLTADKADEQDWRKCRPVPGSLFVVGDPKQSIYRFRRADIVIYNQVKEIILAAGGVVVPLTTNFRTVAELVEWGNSVFDKVFPSTADTWSPAACRMDVGRTEKSDGQFRGLHVLRVPDTHGTKEMALEYESDAVARTIRRALDEKVTIPRTEKELAHGTPPSAEPGDFLIVTRMRKHLALYAQKLGDLGIPHQVTGGSALGQVGELSLLCKCLAAVTEPDNPVALVAVLRGELFGTSDTALYAFRKAGGRFDYRTEIPAGLNAAQAAAFGDAFSRLQRYRLRKSSNGFLRDRCVLSASILASRQIAGTSSWAPLHFSQASHPSCMLFTLRSLPLSPRPICFIGQELRIDHCVPSETCSALIIHRFVLYPDNPKALIFAIDVLANSGNSREADVERNFVRIHVNEDSGANGSRVRLWNFVSWQFALPHITGSLLLSTGPGRVWQPTRMWAETRLS